MNIKHLTEKVVIKWFCSSQYLNCQKLPKLGVGLYDAGFLVLLTLS